jgi:hypothetical protein
MSRKLSLILIIFASVAGYALADDQADYTATVLADNPLSYWQFEDASSHNGGTVADSAAGGLSPGRYRNRLVGNPNDVPEPAFRAGAFDGGKSVFFNGTISNGNGNFVEIFDNVDNGGRLILQSCTVEFWTASQATAAETYARFISHAEGTTNSYWVGETTNGDNHGQPFVGVNGATWYAWPPILNDAKWHHVVVTYDVVDGNTLAELWIDGTSRGTNLSTGTFTGPTDSWCNLIIGAENNQYYVYNGLVGIMDEVAIYDGVLSSDRILAHYNVPEPMTIALLGLGGLLLRRRKR